jgi:hypothetical protein
VRVIVVFVVALATSVTASMAMAATAMAGGADSGDQTLVTVRAPLATFAATSDDGTQGVLHLPRPRDTARVEGDGKGRLLPVAQAVGALIIDEADPQRREGETVHAVLRYQDPDGGEGAANVQLDGLTNHPDTGISANVTLTPEPRPGRLAQDAGDTTETLPDDMTSVRLVAADDIPVRPDGTVATSTYGPSDGYTISLEIHGAPAFPSGTVISLLPKGGSCALDQTTNTYETLTSDPLQPEPTFIASIDGDCIGVASAQWSMRVHLPNTNSIEDKWAYIDVSWWAVSSYSTSCSPLGANPIKCTGTWIASSDNTGEVTIAP